jgi:hypothetical protein
MTQICRKIRNQRVSRSMNRRQGNSGCDERLSQFRYLLFKSDSQAVIGLNGSGCKLLSGCFVTFNP